ncbi:hypothetical protein VC83_07491 [Pseudogymnoascus destructans]|uniref:Protein phosphatase 1 regulatory subunit 7 n=2 Tax=Pseudogymnoascus destructans TaxID=655981 RepID=L8G3N1_PSED2|nr:uncharacterized protein VC83_07491 [Pseudogymnoascus destructans]ELR06551.1 hypothetical protein GMDG_02185 [Pseudogymnoascus destructans 20631-21]OAF56076.1 hypothetical protein VC83_07491 [Pseudogymnoascus destructans]
MVGITEGGTPPQAPQSDDQHPKSPRDSKGWDGKLRVERRPVMTNPEAISDPEYSDEENILRGEQIGPDEDLLLDEPSDVEEIDCIHSRVASVPSLNLDRFTKLVRLCLRQNAITEIEGLSSLAETLRDLDFYDNLISHIKGLEDLTNLTSLDLSFNKIKHIKRVNHLTKLTDLYFVQNKISTIEGLDGLTQLRNLELAANRIRGIQNLDTLTGLEELWLGKNKITEIKGLSSLSSLKILSIQSNRIREISSLEDLQTLEELYISNNALSSLTGLEKNHKLRVLDISNNTVASLAGLGHLEQLEELWASYNKIDSFVDVEKELADKKQLTTVYFEGNPVQLRQPALYRNKVRLALPQIQQIDATFVRVT